MNQLGRISPLTAPNSKTELLIADDGPLIADSPGCFPGRVFAVSTATTRAEAVALQRNRKHAPALALIDLCLPSTPPRPEYLRSLIRRVLSFRDTSAAIDGGLIGVSAPLQKLRAQPRQFAHNNMRQAARLLGINHTTLYNRIETLPRESEVP